MNKDTREFAYEVFQNVMNELDDTIENAHLINFADTDSGVCLEFARHWSSDIYVYCGILFEDGYMTITLENTPYRFHLNNDELETIIETFHDFGY